MLRAAHPGARLLVTPSARELLADAWTLPELRRQVAEARAWAWAEYHREWFLEHTNPHAEAGPASAPPWLRSATPPWPMGAPEDERRSPRCGREGDPSSG